MQLNAGSSGGIRIVVKVDDADLKRLVRKIKDRAENSKRFWERIASIARKAFDRNFYEAGPGWTPLAPSTILDKEQAGYTASQYKKRGRPSSMRQLPPGGKRGTFSSASILIRSGSMRRALTTQGARGHIEDYSDKGVYIGIDPGEFPYAAAHEFGGKRSYPITPRHSKELRFMAVDPYGNPKLVRTQHVNHPPLPARPMTTITKDDLDKMAEAGRLYFLSGI